MKKIIVILICSLFITSSAFSQENYEILGKFSFGGTRVLDCENDAIYFNKGAHTIQSLIISSTNEFVNNGEFYINKMGEIKQICVLNKYVYVAMEYEGLVILDFNNPQLPKLIGNYKPQKPYRPSMVNFITKKNNYVFINNDNELHVIDVTNPYDYKVVSIYQGHTSSIAGIKQYKNYLYLLGNGYECLDISNPANPVSIHTESSSFEDILFSNNRAYITMGYEGLKVFDISNPAEPKELGSYIPSYSQIPSSGFVTKIYGMNENYVFINCDVDGYVSSYLLDVSDPQNIQEKSMFSWVPLEFRTFKNMLISFGGFGDGSEPITTYNIDNPTSPTLINTYYRAATGGATFFQDYAYLTDYKSGYLRTIDLKNQEHPCEINFTILFKKGEEYFLQSTNDLIIAASYRVIRSIDISTPNNPRVIDSLSISVSSPNNLYISDSLAFIVGEYGFEIIDIKDPYNMKKVGEYENSFTQDIFIRGNYVYLTDSGVSVIDISKPESPVKIGDLGISDGIFYLDAIGDKLFGCSLFHKLYIIDISNPLQISLIKKIEYDQGSSFWTGIKIHKDYGFISVAYDTLRVFSLEDQLSPKIIKDLQFGTVAKSSFINNTFICFKGGFTIIRNDPKYDDIKLDPAIPSIFTLSQNYPNPFNPITTINYQIPSAGHVSLKVYDILGREITTLVNEEKTAGNYEIKFNGSGLSSGVYFYRLQSGLFSETKKFMLLK
jgi:hypothetical protein